MLRSLQKQAAQGVGWLCHGQSLSNPLGEGPFFWARSSRVEFPVKEERSALGGRTSYGLGPIRRVVLSGPSDGRASCFIKSPLLAGKAVCLLCGQGPNSAVGNSKPVLRAEIKPGKNRTVF